MIQEVGFILVFRPYSEGLVSHKKDNVDTDIIFSMMKNFHEHPEIDKFFLVSRDG